jgi:glyoxylase-like metal-dependent hydrolase (beta-lactamase superfamily II)
VVVEVAPGVHRLGNPLVNFYLVEADGGMTLVDAGLPGFYDQLEAFLRDRGRRVAEIDALVLTHGHSDHVGIAEKVHREGVPVHVHEGDAQLVRTGDQQPRERSMLPYLRHRATWRLLATAARAGGVKTTKVPAATAFSGSDVTLDVPGRPRAIHTPGHSNGHVVLAFGPALLCGDALCTWNPLTGRPGPQIMPGAFAVSSEQAMDSLTRIEDVAAGVVLPGHGDPWMGGVAPAVAGARAAGPS